MGDFELYCRNIYSWKVILKSSFRLNHSQSLWKDNWFRYRSKFFTHCFQIPFIVSSLCQVQMWNVRGWWNFERPYQDKWLKLSPHFQLLFWNHFTLLTIMSVFSWKCSFSMFSKDWKAWYLQKKVLSEILQNSQENTCARVFFLIKCFLANFAKFLRTPFLQNTSGWLLLEIKRNLSTLGYLC